MNSDDFTLVVYPKRKNGKQKLASKTPPKSMPVFKTGTVDSKTKSKSANLPDNGPDTVVASKAVAVESKSTHMYVHVSVSPVPASVPAPVSMRGPPALKYDPEEYETLNCYCCKKTCRLLRPPRNHTDATCWPMEDCKRCSRFYSELCDGCYTQALENEEKRKCRDEIASRNAFW